MARPQQDADTTEGLGGRANQQTERKKWAIFGEFETMDTEPARIACPPKRLPWAENLLIIGPNDLRAVPGVGDTLATLTGETITARYYAYFNLTDYIVAFCASGAAYTVNVANGAKVNFAVAGTFTPTPDLTQWEDQRILIADTQAGYCTYDGTLFIAEGGVSPNITITQEGIGYDTAPSVTISGGTGSGATATATLTDGSVSAVTLTNAGTGYVFSDILQISFSGGTPTPGGVSSSTVLDGGSGYRTAPTITIAAPSGGGVTATATAVVALGRITAVTITQQGTTYAETPAITITPAGADVDATGGILTAVMQTVASAEVRIWPFTLKPSSIAVFQGRVWYSAVRQLNYTGTKGYDDVDEGNAAGFSILADADVVHYITKLFSANNFLFIICDQSVKQIGTITVQGTLTQFTITSLSSDQGTIYPASVRSYNRTVVFTNEVGVFAIFGASVEKISAPMTGIIEATDFTLAPVCDVFDFYGYHTLLTLVRYNDPDAGSRSLLMAYYAKRWSVISQGNAITGTVTAHLAGRERMFATSGAVISEILSDRDATVPFLIKTSLSHNGEPQINKRAIRVGIGQASSEPNTVNASVDSENGLFSFSFQAGRLITWINNLGQTINWQNNSGDTITWLAGGFVYYDTFVTESGIYLGATISGSFKGYHFNNVTIEYIYGPLMKSRNLT